VPADDLVGVEQALAHVPRRRLNVRRRPVLALCVLLACALAVWIASQAGGGSSTQRVASTGAPAAPQQTGSQQPPPLRPHPKVVVAVPPGEAPPPAAVTAGVTGGTTPSRAPSDAEVRSTLADFRQHLASIGTPHGPIPRVAGGGVAVAPNGAPGVIDQVIAAGNEIATKPYKWGGGHGAWRDNGYDCSGSVSFALAGAGLLDSPLTSGDFMHWGQSGPGRWISIYANSGHVFMVVAGLRFDTSGAQGGTRWQPANGRSYAGFTVRHPPGL